MGRLDMRVLDVFRFSNGRTVLTVETGDPAPAYIQRSRAIVEPIAGEPFAILIDGEMLNTPGTPGVRSIETRDVLASANDDLRGASICLQPLEEPQQT